MIDFITDLVDHTFLLKLTMLNHMFYGRKKLRKNLRHLAIYDFIEVHVVEF
jgi:hypothetical protein